MDENVYLARLKKASNKTGLSIESMCRRKIPLEIMVSSIDSLSKGIEKNCPGTTLCHDRPTEKGV